MIFSKIYLSIIYLLNFIYADILGKLWVIAYDIFVNKGQMGSLRKSVIFDDFSEFNHEKYWSEWFSRIITI